LLAVAEAGGGFGFLAVIIGYLPVFYQAFSRREVTISLLHARAGSPPSAGQFLLRSVPAGNRAAIVSFLSEWERWSAELLEIQISFPVLGFYRSQHDNQSWLAALTCILDTCAIIVAGVKGSETQRLAGDGRPGHGSPNRRKTWRPGPPWCCGRLRTMRLSHLLQPMRQDDLAVSI
jgi:hypothetical protein